MGPRRDNFDSATLDVSQASATHRHERKLARAERNFGTSWTQPSCHMFSRMMVHHHRNLLATSGITWTVELARAYHGQCVAEWEAADTLLYCILHPPS